jgi:transglutaminase-like putative cysteine protease
VLHGALAGLRQVDEEKVLKLPYRGAPQTVGVIRQAALDAQRVYTTRLMAEAVCADLRSKDYLSEILALNNFVWRHTRYMRDPRTVELVQAPWKITDQLKAGQVPQLDCDDMAGLLAALFLAVGCETRVVTVAFRHMYFHNQRQYSHVFAQAKEPRTGTWITCDPVAGVETDKMLRRVVAAKVWPVA